MIHTNLIRRGKITVKGLDGINFYPGEPKNQTKISVVHCTSIFLSLSLSQEHYNLEEKKYPKTALRGRKNNISELGS